MAIRMRRHQRWQTGCDALQDCPKDLTSWRPYCNSKINKVFDAIQNGRTDVIISKIIVRIRLLPRLRPGFDVILCDDKDVMSSKMTARIWKHFRLFPWRKGCWLCYIVDIAFRELFKIFALVLQATQFLNCIPCILCTCFHAQGGNFIYGQDHFFMIGNNRRRRSAIS